MDGLFECSICHGAAVRQCEASGGEVVATRAGTFATGEPIPSSTSAMLRPSLLWLSTRAATGARQVLAVACVRRQAVRRRLDRSCIVVSYWEVLPIVPPRASSSFASSSCQAGAAIRVQREAKSCNATGLQRTARGAQVLFDSRRPMCDY